MEALAARIGGITAADVVVQRGQRQLHDDRAAVAVHDRFGHAGGATGVDDPQRVVERHQQRLEGARGGVVATGDAGEIGVLQSAGAARRQCSEVVEHQQLAHAGQRLAQLCDQRQAVLVAPAIGHAVARDEDFRLDLAEPVQHRIAAHVRRADAPHRADAGRGEEGDHRLRYVGQVGRHPVAGRHAVLLQVQGERRHLPPQLGPAERPGRTTAQRSLVVADDSCAARGMRRIHMPEHLAHIVQLRTRKPAGARHAPLRQHRRVRRR